MVNPILKTRIFGKNFRLKLKDKKIKLKKLRKKFSDAPRKSKRKSFLIGFTAVITVFGFTRFLPVLKAVAKEVDPEPSIPKQTPRPGNIFPDDSIEPDGDLLNKIYLVTYDVVGGIVIGSAVFGLLVATGLVSVLIYLGVQGKKLEEFEKNK